MAVILTNSKPKEGQEKTREVSVYTYCRNLKNYDKAGYKLDKEATDAKNKALIANFIANNK